MEAHLQLHLCTRVSLRGRLTADNQINKCTKKPKEQRNKASIQNKCAVYASLLKFGEKPFHLAKVFNFGRVVNTTSST